MSCVDCNAELLEKWSDELLEEVLRFWQEKLRLTNWDITIRFCRYYELEENVFGMNEFDGASMLSQIYIRHPLDHNVGDSFGKRQKEDIEFTVVHELLHLTTSDWASLRDNGLADGLPIEVCINNMSRTLLSLHRCVPLDKEKDIEKS